MGVRCPFDGTVCPDDLCHGGSCVQSMFEEPEHRCPMCDLWESECECGSDFDDIDAEEEPVQATFRPRDGGAA